MKSSLGQQYKLWLRFLSSMDLAITLLIMLAIASIIGTVIQQNQPYSDYALKFGPFWFEVFEILGLYSVYNQLWFLFVLAFLVLSICFCLWRYTPKLLKEIKHLPQAQPWSHLQHFKYAHQQSTPHEIQTIQQKLSTDKHYRLSEIRTYEDAEGHYWQITGKQGKGQKLGYLFTHIGVIVICVGALLDSSIFLKIDQWLGKLQYETQNIPLSQIDQKSFLPATNRTFRGSVSIPEGKSTKALFLPWSEGYLVQKLPFIVELQDFRTKHYPTGQPSSFESDLIIRDLQGHFRSTHTIDVNNPLHIDGISIYQSSFEDGGSILNMTMQPLLHGDSSTFTLSVFENTPITIDEQPFTLELTNFSLYNIQPLEHSPNKFKNQGPSFEYKLRQANGSATEYKNYMLPIDRDGQQFLISGVRKTVQEAFQYLFIPLDDHASPKRFFTYLQWLSDDDKLTEILSNSTLIQEQFPPQITLNMQKNMVQHFIRQGTDTILEYINTIKDPAQRTQMNQLLINSLYLILSEVYVALISTEKKHQDTIIPQSITDKQAKFYEEAINTLSILNHYQPLVFFQLTSFQHIQASGLQMTKSPGQFWVYLGCLLLVIGVFCMFYLPIAKLWVSIKEGKILIALDSVKNDSEHQKEMQRLIKLLS